MYCQTENVCKLAGYTSDLKDLVPKNKQASLSMFVFDQFLQKVVWQPLYNSCTRKIIQFQLLSSVAVWETVGIKNVTFNAYT
jgi:hypothetical protein